MPTLEEAEGQGNKPDENLSPTVLVLILIVTFLAGVGFGIVVSGAFNLCELGL